MKKGSLVLGTVAGTLVAILLLAVVFVFSGVYDVAADAPHAGPTRWALHALMDRSVERRAESVEATAPTDPEAIRHGFGEYDEMCVSCHGAPGVRPSAVGRGLNPEPPDLAAPDAETNDAELYWIVSHGIKFTGMPAFGATHSEETVWAMVAFLKQLPGMSAEDYARWREDYGEHAEEHEHAGEVGEAMEHEHAEGHEHTPGGA